MVDSSTVVAIAMLSLGLVAGIPIPSPHSVSQLNYIQPGPGSFHYTVIHPPHPHHKFYHSVPVAYTKPLYIYNPFQHQFLLVDNNLHVQVPSVAVADPPVAVPNQELVVPSDDPVPAQKAQVETPVKDAAEAEDDTVAVESEDKKPEGREEVDKDIDSKEVVVVPSEDEDRAGGGDEEDLEGGPSPSKASSESVPDSDKAPVSFSKGSEEEPQKVESATGKEDGADKVEGEAEVPQSADYAAGEDVEDE